MDYKKTLNMPETNFDMKANLTTKEPLFRQMWLDKEVYKNILKFRKHGPKFILHDGPPYANGDLHVGHALNKILKDIVVRYKTMSGFYSPFKAGWDTHGLPIEHKMLTEMQIDKSELDPVILRKKAAEYALSQVKKQKEQFKSLQLLSDLEDIYVTLDKKYETKQLEVFKKMVFDGLVYKGLKPVYWSPTSQSALAEAEVEYQDIKSPAVYVRCKVKDATSNFISSGDYLVIWTTTPWTLIANAGIAYGENIEYSKVLINNEYYIIATELLENFITKLKSPDYQVVSTFNGSHFGELTYTSPVNLNINPVVPGHHVTSEAGTGLVHIAPLFGEDDFLIGQKFNLNKLMHVADDGTIENSNTQFDGMFYLDSNKAISEFLGSEVVAFEWIKHAYPHDWRTHKPIIFRGTPQWFVSIDKIRQQILNQIENNVNTYPDWAKKRLAQMISNRADWTISRQRTWGVPIIIFYDQDKNPVLDPELFDHVINLVSEHGTDIWWEKTTDELLLPKYQNKGFTREMDIMDVWFDSGVSSIAVNIDSELESPYDLYLEGIDQYRGWFNSSIISSVAYKGLSPYKNIVSHGFVLDGKGEKMSKSKGNIISPLDVVKERGADILRLWVANSEYSNDVNISKEILDQNAEIYRKIRNTIKFLLGNLNNYQYQQTELTGIHELINQQ
ncbi:isoleucine--tRNA ligase, partial [Mycoplasma nasistruthionis]|uniref:isoleucine--tRNA ligase n=1 Tax=Mycoplasma nasistruthionis TaxID=353852 RepID=UPI0021CB649E